MTDETQPPDSKEPVSADTAVESSNAPAEPPDTSVELREAGTVPGEADESMEAATDLPEAPAELVAEAEHDPRLKAALVEVERLKELVERGEGKGKKGKKKKEGLGTSRGIETMFRTSYRTHVDLSGLADNKANIMISINGIIISILIASISPGIDKNPWLVWPTTVLLLGCVSAMVFAVLAARPRISSTTVTLEDIKENRANILFFGNFVTMSEPDYVEGMKDLIMDTERLYTNMIRDIYSLGGVLARKFRLLRMAYNLFMIALLVGVPLFIGVFIAIAYFGIAVPLDPGLP